MASIPNYTCMHHFEKQTTFKFRFGHYLEFAVSPLLVYTTKAEILNLYGCHIYAISTIIQSTLVISKSKGPSKTLRDIRTSTYQICSIEEKTI